MKTRGSTSAFSTALLIIDVINDLEFVGGERVLPWAERLITPLLKVRSNAHRAGVSVIYANDNCGRWLYDFSDVYKHCTRARARGRRMSQRLKPTAQDYCILKPRHSAFYSTSLEPLLRHLKVNHLVLTGIATNLCVLFTAHDAHMRDYQITVVSDCCAAESDADHNAALRQLEAFCGARIRQAEAMRFVSDPSERR